LSRCLLQACLIQAEAGRRRRRPGRRGRRRRAPSVWRINAARFGAGLKLHTTQRTTREGSCLTMCRRKTMASSSSKSSPGSEMIASSNGGSAAGEGGSLTTFTSRTISGGETVCGALSPGGSRRPALAGPRTDDSTLAIAAAATGGPCLLFFATGSTSAIPVVVT